ncbi:MAG TPA: response regulator transcription factor [Gaiellaceae bacterium]|nr:response regulator transcription factor [Gaiellaceae bacterium]
MTALLLAEPEPTVRGFLERQLRNDGFDVVSCERAEQLPRAAAPDLLLLGDADALERVLVPDCPVIVLGGADPAARVRALSRADDCLPRPFVYEELLARIHALLRRCPPRVERIDLGPLAIDRAARRVLVAEREVRLSAKEFALLVKLASDPERVFTREQLLRDVWGFRTYVPTRTLESHASRVRRKLAAAGLPGWVVNVWGVGYKLRHVPRPLTASTRPAAGGG